MSDEAIVDRRAAARSLPFSSWWPVFAGALTGVALRIAFSFGLSPMSSSFVVLVPLLVGAVTVAVGERTARRGWLWYASAGALANLLFVVGTLAILIEGIICAIVIAPLMALEGAVGGLLMGVVCRFTSGPRHAVYALAVVPIGLGALEQQLPLPDGLHRVERRIVVAAPAERVWNDIHRASAILPAEVERGWAYRIGVPAPVSGVTEQTPEGRVRRIEMGKGIHFDQLVTEWVEARRVRFAYRFAPDSVPPGALDDHVRIGGRYFDLVATSYDLVPLGPGRTELVLTIDYRVSTTFNWYAEPVARLLIGNTAETLLGLYRERGEAGP